MRPEKDDCFVHLDRVTRQTTIRERTSGLSIALDVIGPQADQREQPGPSRSGIVAGGAPGSLVGNQTSSTGET